MLKKKEVIELEKELEELGVTVNREIVRDFCGDNIVVTIKSEIPIFAEGLLKLSSENMFGDHDYIFGKCGSGTGIRIVYNIQKEYQRDIFKEIALVEHYIDDFILQPIIQECNNIIIANMYKRS